ncbi:hypothetical protein [Gynuella sp.]|uniref:hypothetical protein n=1 Tax=Gynuella sp. TaxID=2969146 RepID=UPI003D14F09B
MTRRFYNIALAAWLSYFAIPLVNGYGAINGRMVQLCTVYGIKIVLLEDDQQSRHGASGLSHEGCPCVHFLLDTHDTVLISRINQAFQMTPSSAVTEVSVDILPHYFARAPPQNSFSV